MPVLASLRQSTAVPVVVALVWLNGMVLDDALARGVRTQAVRFSYGPIAAQLDAILNAPICDPRTPAGGKDKDRSPMTGCHAVACSDPRKNFKRPAKPDQPTV